MKLEDFKIGDRYIVTNIDKWWDTERYNKFGYGLNPIACFDNGDIVQVVCLHEELCFEACDSVGGFSQDIFSLIDDGGKDFDFNGSVALLEEGTEPIWECIKTHVGGTKFFDELDALIRKTELFARTLLRLALMESERMDFKGSPTLVVSGKFGARFKSFFESMCSDVVCLEGGLRYNDIQNAEQYKNRLNGKYCFFIDDSYFKGRTFDKVKQLINDSNGVCLGAFVAYDGSKLWNPEVRSFFRYYDHFGGEKS